MNPFTLKFRLRSLWASVVLSRWDNLFSVNSKWAFNILRTEYIFFVVFIYPIRQKEKKGLTFVGCQFSNNKTRISSQRFYWNANFAWNGISMSRLIFLPLFGFLLCAVIGHGLEMKTKVKWRAHDERRTHPLTTIIFAVALWMEKALRVPTISMIQSVIFNTLWYNRCRLWIYKLYLWKHFSWH